MTPLGTPGVVLMGLGNPWVQLRVSWPILRESLPHDAVINNARRRLAELVTEGQAARADIRVAFRPSGRMVVVADSPFAITHLVPPENASCGRVDIAQHARAVLLLVSQGRTDPQIADDLGVTREAVGAYRRKHGIPSGRSRRGQG